MSAEQVLTQHLTSQSEKTSPDQSPKALGDIASVLVASLLVRADPQKERSGDGPRPEQRPTRKPRQSRRGGWPSSGCLSWQEVKEIDSSVHELVGYGCAPTHLVTIMPMSGDASARKRVCTRETAHLGQALKRHGRPHIGLTIFEHPTGADLHAHHLVYAPLDERGTVERRHRPPEVHVERIRDLREVIDYVTKQRRRLSPEFEARIRRSWQRTRLLPGKRWTVTGDARALLAESEQRTTRS
jgi:hypothetical protein